MALKQINPIINSLNELLANYQVYYQNLRAIHWNIKGPNFFNLHVKFEELYNDAQLKIDELAERILTLEGIPLHTFSDYIATASIKEQKNINKDKDAVKLIVKNIEVLLKLERKILVNTSNSNDDGTQDLLTQFISYQEKILWMFKAWLA